MAKIPWMIAEVVLEWDCQACKGTGSGGLRTWCEVCGLANPTIKDGNPICGHGWGAFREEQMACSECEGEGRISQAVTVRELVEAITEFQK